MPLADIGLITEAIMFVLRTRVPEVLGIGPVSTSAAGPDEVAAENGENTISLFLYHAMEDAYYKNAPPASGGTNAPQVAMAPMGLNLFYVLTTHHQMGTDSSQNTLREQLLFGGALKTLHDIPVITQHTVVGGLNVFDQFLIPAGNAIELICRPLTPEDSTGFWASEQTKVTRLSAYYEARVIFLPPEPPTLAAAGIVLNLGAYVFTDGSPQITCSTSRVGFALPAAAGSLDEPVELSPAKVALLAQDDAPLPPLPPIAETNNVLDLVGSGLARDQTTVRLSSTRWVGPGNPSGTVVIDPAENPQWYVGSTITDGLVRIRVRPEITVGLATFDVQPGSYSARVTVSRTIDPPGPALTRPLESLSNAVGLTITPQVLDVPDIPGGSQAGSLTIVGDYLLDTDVTVELFIAGVAFEPITGPPAAGQFELVAGGTLVQFVLTGPLDTALGPDTPLPLRLVVNGADAPPTWVQRP